MDKKMFDMSEFYRDPDPIMIRNTQREAEKCCITEKCDDPLTMVFINMQQLDSVYSPCEAFCNGTLFPELNKPFYGGKRR